MELNRILWILRLVVLFVLSIQPIAAREMPYKGQVIAVTDGDTIKVLHDGASETIRLEGIDCPEKRQAFGRSAKNFTSDMCFGKIVTVSPKTRDRYGRTIGEIVLPDGRDLNHELVAGGYAWWYQKYSPQAGDLQQLELSARDKHIGLWADPNPTAPWDFRHQRKAP